MPNFWGCRCCGQSQCGCVKLSDFAEEEWDSSNDFHPLYGYTSDALYYAGTTKAAYFSDGGTGSLTVSTEVDGDDVVIKVRLQGTYNLTGTSGVEAFEAAAWIDTPIDNSVMKWPSKFWLCWRESGNAENIWTRTRTTGPPMSDEAWTVETQPIMVHVAHPASYEGGGDAEAWNDERATLGPTVRKYGTPTALAVHNGSSSRSHYLDRSNGELYETGFPNVSGAMPLADGTNPIKPDDWISNANWPLRFGFLVRWNLEKGFNHEIDTTITVARFRVGFPERVNFQCFGHLIENHYTMFTDAIYWRGIYGMFQNTNLPTIVDGGFTYYSFPKIPVETAEDFAALGTPDTNPSAWGELDFVDRTTGDITGLSRVNFFAQAEQGSTSLCRVLPSYISSSTGWLWKHWYREVCQDDGSYKQFWTTQLLWKNYLEEPVLIQEWRLEDPDLGAWNVMEPVGGYIQFLTDAEKANISLMLAWYKNSDIPTTGSSTPLFPTWTAYFMNNSPGYVPP